MSAVFEKGRGEVGEKTDSSLKERELANQYPLGSLGVPKSTSKLVVRRTMPPFHALLALVLSRMALVVAQASIHVPF